MTLAEQDLRHKLRERITWIRQRPDQTRMWLPDTLELIATALDSTEQGIDDNNEAIKLIAKETLGAIIAITNRLDQLEQRIDAQKDDGR
jgi:hypothetical protein